MNMLILFIMCIFSTLCNAQPVRVEDASEQLTQITQIFQKFADDFHKAYRGYIWVADRDYTAYVKRKEVTITKESKVQSAASDVNVLSLPELKLPNLIVEDLQSSLTQLTEATKTFQTTLVAAIESLNTTVATPSNLDGVRELIFGNSKAHEYRGRINRERRETGNFFTDGIFGALEDLFSAIGAKIKEFFVNLVVPFQEGLLKFLIAVIEPVLTEIVAVLMTLIPVVTALIETLVKFVEFVLQLILGLITQLNTILYLLEYFLLLSLLYFYSRDLIYVAVLAVFLLLTLGVRRT